MMDLANVPLIIVDDTRFSRALLRSTLDHAGYKDIRVATTAKEAVHMLTERRANVVLADWNMPEMNGLELAQKIRQADEDSNHYTAIILFTGNADIELLIKAFEHGVDDYLTKSPDKRELIARVYAASRIAELQNTLLATTVELMESNQRLMDIVTIDPLTGLNNKRYIQQQLDGLLKEVKTRGGSVSCALIDIDHFQTVNTDYGQDSGDAVLIELAQRLRRAVRPTDLVARYSGGEFAVLMYHRGDEGSCGAFKRIHSSLCRRKIKTAKNEISVTTSIGVYSHRGDDSGITHKTILEQAEKKLQQAKRQGRNRVVE